MNKRTMNTAGRLARRIILILLIVCVLGATFAANAAADPTKIPSATVTGGTLKASMLSSYEEGIPYGYLYIIEIPAESASTNKIQFAIGSPGWSTKYELVSIIANSDGDGFDYGKVTHEFRDGTLIFSLEGVEICTVLDRYDPSLSDNNAFVSWKDLQYYVLQAYLNDDDTYVTILVYEASGSTVDKTLLRDRLESVPQTGYYTENDRFNGTKTSKQGFWAEMQSIVSAAREVYNNENASQPQVDAVAASLNLEEETSDLSQAVARLIPTSQLNATYLYETLQQYNYGEEYLENCTVPSAQGFRAARSEAQNYFDALFNRDGSATSVNIAANQKTADDYADALKNHKLVFNDQVDEAKVNLRTIQALAKRYAMTENGGKYTEESWTAFETARKAATDYAAAHSISEYISSAEVKQYAALTREFLSAAYGLTPASDTVTVTFSYTDDLHLRVPNPNDPYNLMADPAGNKPQIQTVTLNKEAVCKMQKRPEVCAHLCKSFL